MNTKLLAVAALLLNVGCMTGPKNIIFSSSTSGGCARNNSCIGFFIYDNGTYDATIGGIHEGGRVERNGKVLTYYKITHSGVIDPVIFNEWKALFNALDIPELKKSLEPGILAGTFDGVDYMMGFEKDSHSYLLSSIEYKLDPTIPFFAKSY